MLSLFHIADELHESRGEGHGQDGAESAGKLGADDEGQDDEDGRDADDLAHDERIDEIALELVDDDVEADNEDGLGRSSHGKSGDEGRNGRHDGAKDRDELEHGGQGCEEECMRHVQDEEAEIDEDADDDAEKELSLEPEADLAARAAPKADDVVMAFDRRDDAEEIDHAVFLDRQIERDDGDEEKGERAAEYDAGRMESAPGRAGDRVLQVDGQLLERHGLTGYRKEVLHRRPQVADADGVGHRGKVVHRLAEELGNEEKDDACECEAHDDVHADDGRNAVDAVADAPLRGRLDGRGDDDGGENDEDDAAQIPKDVKEDEDEDSLEDRAGGDGDDSVFHTK